jgi:integrase
MQRTVSDLLAHYRKMVVNRCENLARKRNLDVYLRFFESDQLAQLEVAKVKRSDLHECRERLLDGLKQRTRKGGIAPYATANRYFQTLMRAFSVARTIWGWEDAESYPKIPKLKEPKPRTDFLSPEQRKDLLEACKQSENKQLYLIVVIAIGTGIRKGEIRKLRWSNTDIESGISIIDETKNGEPLRVKFGDYPLRLLREYYQQRDPNQDLFFPYSFDAAWRTAHRRAGLPKSFVFHSLRHSFASDLAKAGAQAFDIAKLMNHKSIATTKRYTHLTHGHTDSLVEKINRTQFES